MDSDNVLRFFERGRWPTKSEWDRLTPDAQWKLTMSGISFDTGDYFKGIVGHWEDSEGNTLLLGDEEFVPGSRFVIDRVEMFAGWDSYGSGPMGETLTREEAERILARSAELYPRPQATRRQIREFIEEARRLHGVRLTEEQAIYELSRRGFRPLSKETKALLSRLARERASTQSMFEVFWARGLSKQSNAVLEYLRSSISEGNVRGLEQALDAALSRAAPNAIMSQEAYANAMYAFGQVAKIQVRTEVVLSGKATTYINWREIDRQIARWSTKHVGELITEVGDASIDKVKKYVAQFLSDENMTFKDLEKKIAKEFGEERAARIANTELTRAASAGVDEFVGHAISQGFRVDTVWHTDQGENSCEECLALDDERNPKETPPLHPNCTCTLGIDWVGFEDEAEEYVTGMQLPPPAPLAVEGVFREA